ncbi:hypothetical protein RND81_02G209600 [Saponaria officinalis]|uniref:Uncharacterized protein n=1 Tax=Saponaria officinalis TaxID=3572 RepID=A0AAW1MP78_SAPOF
MENKGRYYKNIVLIITSWLLIVTISTCLGANNTEDYNSNNNKEGVIVTIRGATSIAKTDDNFICATLDWWPSTKCDYGHCPWSNSSILNLDLDNKILHKALKAFNNIRLRIGGSLQDQVFYNVGTTEGQCRDFSKSSEGLFGFDNGCLRMERWDKLAKLFNETGAKITFGLNALVGRVKIKGDDLFVGDWNSQNAQDFIQYNLLKGYNIDSYELGNELCGSGISARVEANQYAKDMIRIKQVMNGLFPDPKTRPKVLGPGGFYDEEWFNIFLQESGPYVVDGLTHHIYNLGAGVDKELINRVQDPYYLSQIAQTYKDVAKAVDRFGPWSQAWVGESGGAYNSGGKDVSDTFADGFWYLDQLGMTSTFNHKVFCRQALIGGNYALLNTTTFIPNPDYYGALLWDRLMGNNVLATTHNGSPYLRAYSHCSKTQSGVSVMLINMSNSTTFTVSLMNDFNFFSDPSMSTKDVEMQQREEYHLTPKDGNIQSQVVLLNGKSLRVNQSFDIPELKPKFVNTISPITVMPQSFVFATITNFHAPVCVKS